MSADSWCPAENYNDRGPNRASIIRLASATISSVRLFSRLDGLSANARVDPGAKIAALQPFPTGLTSIRYPLYSIAVMCRLSKVPQSPSHARAGLGAALIRVNRIAANGHSSLPPGEAIVVCAVESIRGRSLSVFLPVLGCVSPSARRALILFDLVAPYKSYRRSPSGAVAAFAKTTAGGTCAETLRSCRAE
jgi:hypothetical protein